METVYSVDLFIAEKNCTKEQLDTLVSVLEEEHNFELRGSKFTGGPDPQHHGTLLSKTCSGEDANIILDGVKAQLEDIQTPGTTRYNCQLNVAGISIATDTIFIT